MKDKMQQRAQSVVDGFKESLSGEVRGKITSAQFEELRLAVQKAISEERLDSLGRIEDLIKQLRAGAQMSEIGL